MTACTSAGDNGKVENVDSKSFKPGIGFFMGKFQTFHAKLGTSIDEENLDLVNFYIHELEENIEELEEIHTGRNEIAPLHTLFVPIESIENALAKADFVAMREGYLQLTSTCNACHEAVGYGFIKIKVADEKSFPNQDFSNK